MYNQKLATVCEMLQAIDPNGFYDEVYQEWQEGELSLSEAMNELKEVTNNMFEEHGETKQLKSIIEYINY